MFGRSSIKPIPGTTVNEIEHALGVREAVRRYMLYVLLPLWLVPGVVDWASHKKTKIEATSGTTESVLHALMMTEIGIPITLGLFCEINSTTLRLMFLSALVHELTAFCDVVYTSPRRKITAIENMTHSFLEVLPFTAVSFVACLHWDQVAAMFGDKAKERTGLRLKLLPASGLYRAKILSAVAVCVVLPFAEELYRCVRYQLKNGRKAKSATSSRAIEPKMNTLSGKLTTAESADQYLDRIA